MPRSRARCCASCSSTRAPHAKVSVRVERAFTDDPELYGFDAAQSLRPLGSVPGAGGSRIDIPLPPRSATLAVAGLVEPAATVPVSPLAGALALLGALAVSGILVVGRR